MVNAEMEKTGGQVVEKRQNPFVSFLNRVGGVFLAPEATFDQIIADKTGFWEPLLLIILLVAIQGAVVASFAYRVFSVVSAAGSLSGMMPGLGLFSVILVTVVFVAIITTLIAWVILSGIAHLSAKYMFRGEGSFVQLLKLYGYAIVPTSLTILGTVLFELSWTVWPLSVFLSVIAVFWGVVLMAIAVRQNYKIDTGKAFISSFIGPMVIWLIVTGATWAWMLLIIRSLTGGAI
jgi:hypothetical protein